MHGITRRRFIQGSFLGASLSLFAPFSFTRASTHADNSRKNSVKRIMRRLGKTGIELPVVSMGVMNADNPSLVRAAIEAGIVYFDTAHGYQRGNNETMLGQVLKGYPRESFVIGTKIHPEGKDGMLSKLDLSLQRLQMPYVDILFVHGARSKEDVVSSDTLDALKSAKAAGKVRHLGVSTHRNVPEVTRAAMESGVYEVVLASVNFKQGEYPEIARALAEATGAGLGIIAMKTMAGAFHDKERTKPINCKAALKWVLQNENIATAIPGITTFDQLTENVSVNEDLSMTEQEKSDIAVGKAEGSLYCQGCDRCVPQCPRRLPIPDLMRSYMYTYGYRNPSMARDLLASLAVDRDPCRGCASCAVRCVQGLNVPERIADIARLTSVPHEFLL